LLRPALPVIVCLRAPRCADQVENGDLVLRVYCSRGMARRALTIRFTEKFSCDIGIICAIQYLYPPHLE
jgi:hypothetical protein